jgi:hypothetical protein
MQYYQIILYKTVSIANFLNSEIKFVPGNQ